MLFHVPTPRFPLSRAFWHTVPARGYFCLSSAQLCAHVANRPSEIANRSDGGLFVVGKFHSIPIRDDFQYSLSVDVYFKIANFFFLFFFFSLLVFIWSERSLLMNFRLYQKSWSSSRAERKQRERERERGNPAVGILLSVRIIGCPAGSSFKQRELAAGNIRTNINNSFFFALG